MGGFRPGPLAVVSPGRGAGGPAGPGPRPSGVLELGVMQRKPLTQIRAAFQRRTQCAECQTPTAMKWLYRDNYLCPGCFHNHLRLDHESDLY